MARRRFKFRTSDYSIIDCPNCGEGDDRNLGMNVCGLCECRFDVKSYSRNAIWSRRDGVLTRLEIVSPVASEQRQGGEQ